MIRGGQGCGCGGGELPYRPGPWHGQTEFGSVADEQTLQVGDPADPSDRATNARPRGRGRRDHRMPWGHWLVVGLVLYLLLR